MIYSLLKWQYVSVFLINCRGLILQWCRVCCIGGARVYEHIRCEQVLSRGYYKYFLFFFWRIILLVWHWMNGAEGWRMGGGKALVRLRWTRRCILFFFFFFFGRRRIDLIELKCEMRSSIESWASGSKTTMRPNTLCTLYTYVRTLLLLCIYVPTFIPLFLVRVLYLCFSFLFSFYSLWNPLNHNRIRSPQRPVAAIHRRG